MGASKIVGCMTAYGDDRSLLARSLSAMAPFVDRIVVGIGRYMHHEPVDPEAVIQTVIAVRGMGAELVVPEPSEEGEWAWDERDARTKVASQCDTGDWCLWADADECWHGDPKSLRERLELAERSLTACLFVNSMRPLNEDVKPLWVPKLYRYAAGQRFTHDYIVKDPDGEFVTHVRGDAAAGTLRVYPFADLDPEVGHLLHYREERTKERTDMTGRYQVARKKEGYGSG